MKKCQMPTPSTLFCLTLFFRSRPKALSGNTEKVLTVLLNFENNWLEVKLTSATQPECKESSGGRRRTAAINPPFPPSSKDTAGENRGRLLATNPHDPTSRCLISRRSVIAGH
ncbi:hypothetical protein T03_7848 [Trichinella britovi]|uniref:Uncharacterized protein n=1 Tax=Trichinella britovi TaxID=45882 RepID=A0A0V1CZE3_TRIBR|nr:hypothetical protein T03_7848 [Trichinella britovi]